MISCQYHAVLVGGQFSPWTPSWGLGVMSCLDLRWHVRCNELLPARGIGKPTWVTQKYTWTLLVTQISQSYRHRPSPRPFFTTTHGKKRDGEALKKHMYVSQLQRCEGTVAELSRDDLMSGCLTFLQPSGCESDQKRLHLIRH